MLLYYRRIFQMGWRHLAFSCLVSMAFPGSPLSDLWDQALQRASPCRDLTGVHGASHHVQHADRLCLGHRLCPFPCSFQGLSSPKSCTPRMVEASILFPLLAVPFFILAGELLNTGGVTTRLVALAKVLVRFYPCGLDGKTVLWRIFFLWNFRLNSGDVSANVHHGPALKKGRLYNQMKPYPLFSSFGHGMLVRLIPSVVGRDNGCPWSPFCGGFLPAIVIALCIMALIYIQAVRSKIPLEKTPSV